MLSEITRATHSALYTDRETCLQFLRNIPPVDYRSPVEFHFYWKTLRPFGRKQILPIKSFLATQAANCRAVLWSDTDLRNNAWLKPWLKHIELRVYSPAKESVGTPLENFRLIGHDDNMVYAGGDLFRALVTYKYGGVYVDMDTVFMRDFGPVLAIEQEFMYQWGTSSTISSAVMRLYQRSELGTRMLKLLSATPTGPTNWGEGVNRQAFQQQPFLVFPAVFFNPEWVGKCQYENSAMLEPGDPSHYDGCFCWHWCNRWDDPILPGSLFERFEQLTEAKLLERGLP